MVAVAASLALIAAAQAQSFTWGGTGSTTGNSTYTLGTNWSNPPVGAPPVAGGQSAVFDTTGNSTVNVAVPIAPDSWIFDAASKSFSINGSAVQFGVAGAGGGIIDNAGFPQTISISNNIGESIAGVQVQQLGTGTLILSGANTYSGGTTISAGTLVAQHQSAGAIDALGSFDITMTGGTLRFGVDGALANNITLSSGTGTVSAGSHNVTLDGAVTLGPATVMQFGIAGDTGTLVLAGGGTAASDAAVVIAGGTVQDGGNASITSLTFSAASTTVNAGATLDFNDSFNQAIHNLSGNGSVVTGTAGGTTLTLFADPGATSIFGGVISGPGALLLETTGVGGTIVFTGANTYTGGTMVCSCTTFQLGDATHTGSIVGDVTVFGTFNIVNANTGGITSITNDFEFGASLPGLTTFLNATSAGTMTITNQNGGETDFGLAFGSDTATAGNATIVNRSGSFTVFNAMTTAGSATITNRYGGETDFYDQSNAGSATIVNRYNGVTTFNDFSMAMNATITNRFGGSTLFYNNSTAGNAAITNGSSGTSSGSFPPVGVGFFDASTAGTATIVNNNHGLVDFGTPAFIGGIDTASADHATIINNSGSDLEFNAFTRAGSATIITNNGGAVKFFDFSTGENAQFITNGTGYVDFSETTGLLGDGHIAAGSIAGSGTYYIGGFNTLTVGGNNLSTEVSGIIADNNPCGCTSGPGTLEKIGTGTLTLSGANTYTGATLVNGGTLLVTGSIASSTDVIVSNGATLGGTGTVPITLLSTGAILAPGLPTALGMLTVNDVLEFCSCTFYDIKLTSTGNDLTNVVRSVTPFGFASLEGTVRVTSLNNTYRFNSPYTILTAQGGFDTGFGVTKFDSLVTPTGMNGVLTYTATDVDLTLSSALGQLPGLNINQRNVANALDFGFNTTGLSGALGAIFNGNVLQNLTQASGELATSTQQATFNAMNLFMGLLTDPFIDGRGGAGGTGGGTTPFAEESASAYAAKKPDDARNAFAKLPTKADAARNDLLDPHWSVWGASYGGGSSTSGNAALGSNNSTVRAFGLVAGADYRISPTLLAGFALAGGGTNFGVSGFGSGRSDLFQAGAFVRKNAGPAYVSAALAYGWQQVTTDRTVTIAGLDQLHAQFNANTWSGRVEGGYRFVTPWMGVTPYAAGQFTSFGLPAYAEQALVGNNTFALNYAAKDVTAVRTELGARLDRSFALQGAILTLRGRFAWAHDYNADRNIAATFQTLPGASFVVNGAAQAHDSALTTASAEMKWQNGFSLAATFEGEFSYVTSSFAGKGVARYTW